MSSTLVIAGAVGALYAWATMLPFVLISQVGLTPTEFGIGMLMQSGLFFSGTVTMRLMMRRFTPQALVPAGLFFIGAASLALAFTMHALEPTFLSVMTPIGIYAFGIAFVMPYMMTAAMALSAYRRHGFGDDGLHPDERRASAARLPLSSAYRPWRSERSFRASAFSRLQAISGTAGRFA